MRAHPRQIAILLLTTSVLAAPGLAAAQQADPDPNIAVQDRARPEFDPLGLRAGSFFIYPEITLGALYDSNVFAEDDDAESDVALTLEPNVLVKSNFSRHLLELVAGAELTRYADNDELDYEDYFARGRGRLDITRDDSLTGALGISRLHEDPSDPDFGRENGEVTEFYRGEADLAYRHDFARLYTVLGGSLTRLDFEDTGGINQDDRDRNQYQARTRVGYEISPRLSAFGQGSYDVRRYDETPDSRGVDRDSEGVSFRAGAEIDFTTILFGEIGAGYNYRWYDDEALDNVGGFGYDAALTWNFTPLTTIILEGSGEVVETTVNFEGDEATANLRKSVTLDVWHELLRNVLLNATAGYVRDDFDGTDRTDNTFLAGAGVRYLLNRNLAVDGTYRFTTRDSDASEAEYDRSVVRVGVTARL